MKISRKSFWVRTAYPYGVPKQVNLCELGRKFIAGLFREGGWHFFWWICYLVFFLLVPVVFLFGGWPDSITSRELTFKKYPLPTLGKSERRLWPIIPLLTIVMGYYLVATDFYLLWSRYGWPTGMPVQDTSFVFLYVKILGWISIIHGFLGIILIIVRQFMVWEPLTVTWQTVRGKICPILDVVD